MRAVIASVVWIAVVVAAIAAHTHFLWTPAIERGTTAAIEQHLARVLEDAARRKKIGSAAFVLVERGEIAAERGFGVANVETNGPVRVDRTLYKVASVSKPVTAWGVMRLVEEGRLDLDAPVAPHLAKWPIPGGERVTARHLLSHTSGIDDEPTRATFNQWLASKKSPLPVRATRPPGTQLSYSTDGYNILQLVAESITGQPFAVYMKSAILDPLGMHHSGFGIDAVAARDLATSFDHDLRPVPHRRERATAGAALYATPHDLGRFVQASYAPAAVLRPETVAQMVQPQPGTYGTWGLGYTLHAPGIIGHDGGSPPAWGAMLRLSRASGNGMALTVSGGRGAVNQLGHDWVYWETGVITPAARRQMMIGRIPLAIGLALAGVIAIVVVAMRRP